MKGVVIHLLILCAGITVSAAAGLDELPPYTPDANAERAGIPDVYKWDLTPLCADREACDQLAGQVREGLEQLAGLRQELDTAQGLADYLSLYLKTERQVNILTVHASMERETETTNQELIARHQESLGLLDALMDEGPVVREAILGRSPEELAEAYQQVPQLAEYRPYIESLYRRKERVRSPETEKVLALAGDNLWAQIDLNELPSSLEESFAALISELPLPRIQVGEDEQVQLTFANYGRLRSDQDRQVRKQAVTAMFGTLRQLENTFAALVAGQLQLNVFLARARGYDTAIEAYLDKDNLDPEVYRTLIRTVRANTGALHRYVDLRKKVLGLDSVHIYDLYIPLVEGVSRDIPYPEGAAMIQAALAPLGQEYGELLAHAIDPANGWVDLYPSRDKRSGAYSVVAFGSHPYIKMNYQNQFDDVSTMAHELGHAMHSHLSMTHQPYVSYRYVPFLAEVASTCNEVLLSRHMIANAASDKERAWLLSELLETIRTTIYRQTLFAEHELRIHEMVEAGKPVTAEAVNQVYGDLIRDYYGPGFTIDQDDPLEWAYIPHFYWKFYVYTYATGLSSGIAMAERLATGDEAARDAYLEMLGAGCSKPPLDTLRDAGVDLTRPEPIESALQLFDRTLDELEELLLTDQDQV
jgi:oligoendopeptidase F